MQTNTVLSFSPTGHRGLCEHSLKCLNSRITEQKLQGTWLPALAREPGLIPRITQLCGASSSAQVAFTLSTLRTAHEAQGRDRGQGGRPPPPQITLLLNRRSVQTLSSSWLMSQRPGLPGGRVTV